MLRKLPAECRAVLSPGILLSGCAHVVDLAPIRDDLGQAWAKKGESIRCRLEGILRQYLSANDFYCPVGDTAYLVVMPGSTAEQSATICLSVIHEVLIALFGACDFNLVCIARTFESDDGVLRTERFSREAVKHLAGKAQLREQAAEPSAEPPPAAAKDASQPSAAPGIEIAHTYEPIWDARHEAVATYLCVAKPTVARGTTSKSVPLDDLPLHERLRIELSTIEAGAELLGKQLERGNRFILGVPLSFEIMGAPRSRKEVANLCRSLPAALRQHFKFLITGIPVGVTQSRLMDFAMTLSHFGRIVASVASGNRNLGVYSGLGLWGLAYDMTEARIGSDRTAADLSQIVAMGRSKGLATFAYNIRDVDGLLHSKNAGVTRLHGAAVGLPLDAPKPMARLPWPDLIHSANAVYSLAS